jgi:hypothetical protein
MSIIWEFLTGDLLPYLIAAVVGLGAYIKGRRDSTAKRVAKDAKAYQSTTERMQDAEAAFGDDPAILRNRMRDRNPDQR